MDLHPTVVEFFHGAVTDAMKSRGVQAAEGTEFYLVNLLVEYTRPDPREDEPLALKMAQVANATPDERVRALKEVGDRSLYVSGFFCESLSRRLVDIEYYIAMGGSAYGQLARLMSAMRGSAQQLFQTVYDELSAKFALFVNVLNEIRKGMNFAASTNVVRMYEEWLRTRSDVLEQRL